MAPVPGAVIKFPTSLLNLRTWEALVYNMNMTILVCG